MVGGPPLRYTRSHDGEVNDFWFYCCKPEVKPEVIYFTVVHAPRYAVHERVLYFETHVFRVLRDLL